MDETKICRTCGRILPIENFRLTTGQFYNPYYRNDCKECERKKNREYSKQSREIKLSDKIEILIQRKYKDIKPERILDATVASINLIGEDEIFVKLMDYKDIWLSNYGRVIKLNDNQYSLLQGNYDSYGTLRYSVSKNVWTGDKWKYKKVGLHAAKAVVETFVVNPDKANNIYIWHRGYNKQDYYYKSLYPLNQDQYKTVKRSFMKTGDDSEEFIIKVMNDIQYKPDNWSSKCMEPVMCGIGYRGSDDFERNSESYFRWHDMLSRCYNAKFHEHQPQYIGCTVCEEWLNYSNFKVWYDQNKIPGQRMDLDKDILFKGNTVYSPETCCFVPHCINTLFLNCKKCRGDCPLGVHFDKDKGKYRAEMAFMGKSVKLGTFETAEDAFARYKEYKEDFIKDMAELHKNELPDKVYQAMLNWTVEIGD